VPRDRQAAKRFLITVPEIGRNPCNDKEGSQEVQDLSCSSKTHKIYVVVNLGEIRECSSANNLNCPSDGVFQYNTNLAFDNEGTIVAK
jgi:hypothetical protein